MRGGIVNWNPPDGRGAGVKPPQAEFFLHILMDSEGFLKICLPLKKHFFHPCFFSSQVEMFLSGLERAELRFADLGGPPDFF